MSQEKWTLEQCISYALDNNLQIKQKELSEQLAKNLHIQSKAALLPSLNADASYNINYGRSLDPTTYDFVNQQIQTSSYSLTSSLTLFSGFRKLNTIQQNKYDLLASQYDKENTINDISLNIAAAYLQILLSTEELKAAEQRTQLSIDQTEQTRTLVDAGAQAEGALLDMLAQLSRDSLSLITAQNTLALSKLNLATILRLDDFSNFEVSTPEISLENIQLAQASDPETIYQTALNNQPIVKWADYSLKSAEKDLALAKGLHAPSLSIFANMRTSHSSFARRLAGQSNIVSQIGYVDDPAQTPVLSQYAVPFYERTPLPDQYNENFNQTVGIGLSIPIFNAWQTHTSVKNAHLRLISAQYSEQLTRDQLKNDIYRAHVDASGAWQSYKTGQKSVAALQRAFEYTQDRFNLGAANSVEYSTASTNLQTAEISLLKAKYDYIFKAKVLDYYIGNPITLE